MNITKRQAKQALGFTTDAELARFFGIGRWAVGQWPDDSPIPKARAWMLAARHPDLFSGTDERVPGESRAA